MDEYIVFHINTIPLPGEEHIKECVRQEALKQRSIITEKLGKSPDVILLSPLAYEAVVQIVNTPLCGQSACVIPVSFCGMKIMVIGDMEGIYVKAILEDVQQEYLDGKHIRGKA